MSVRYLTATKHMLIPATDLNMCAHIRNINRLPVRCQVVGKGIPIQVLYGNT